MQYILAACNAARAPVLRQAHLGSGDSDVSQLLGQTHELGVTARDSLAVAGAVGAHDVRQPPSCAATAGAISRMHGNRRSDLQVLSALSSGASSRSNGCFHMLLGNCHVC